MDICKILVIIRIIREDNKSVKSAAKFKGIIDLPFSFTEAIRNRVISLSIDDLATLWVTIEKIQWLKSKTKSIKERTGLLPQYTIEVEWKTIYASDFDAVLKALESDPAYEKTH